MADRVDAFMPNKVAIGCAKASMLNHIEACREMLNQLEKRVSSIPETDNAEHTRKVYDLDTEVYRMRRIIGETVVYGK